MFAIDSFKIFPLRNTYISKMKTNLLICLTLILGFSIVNSASANNMLVQNVTTLGNDPVNKTIQVQFDISWDNSWRDAINYDAAWIFMKFKDANGLWQHAQLNQTGFTNGTGTANTLQVTSDKIGSWLYRSALGSGTFNATGMQLQWNYGLSGLTNVTGLEVRVFAVEMVYVPEGEFNATKMFFDNTEFCRNFRSFSAPGNNFPVINNRISPTLEYNDGVQLSVRIKGDAGIDTNNDGVIDNTLYPTGFKAFYCYKYELTEQQYADFLNTLTSSQITTLGVAGTAITLTNGQYFSSAPNKACGNANANRILSFADWSGLRNISFLEINKASYGPLQPVFYEEGTGCSGPCSPFPILSKYGYPTSGNGNIVIGLNNVGSLSNSNTNRAQSGASYYGIMDLTGNAKEPIVSLSYLNYNNSNGDGLLSVNGLFNNNLWNVNMLKHFEFSKTAQGCNTSSNWTTELGFRYVRSAE
jgi:hypothetical protein